MSHVDTKDDLQSSGILRSIRVLLADKNGISQNATNELLLEAIADNILNLRIIERRVTEIEKLTPIVRVCLWIGMIVGLSIIALMFSLITGSSKIIMP